MNKLFDQSGTTPEDQNDQPESFINELVGEGKKFQDQEQLAKSAWHQEAYIKRLEKENEEARLEIQKRLAVEEYINQMKSVPTKQDEPEPNKQSEIAFDPTSLKSSLMSDVEKLLNQQKQQTVAERNVEKVSAALQTLWGQGYQAKLNQRATELGLDKDYLANLAETKPDTFLKIIAPQQVNIPTAPRSSTTGFNTGGTGDRNKAYYDKIRKDNPKLYYSREIQVQEHKDAIRLGDKFFN